jgi:uncharacterized OsmC-like protein
MRARHEEAKQLVNGVDVNKLDEMKKAIEKDPDLATFTFRAVNEWIDGAQNKTVVHRFDGGNEQVERDRPFVIQSDEPHILLGADSAPNSIVSLLHSLASCLSTSIVYNAAERGITLDKLSIAMEGDLDLHGFLGLSTEVRPGFQDVRVKVNIASSASKAELEDLVRHSQKISPILDSLRNRIPVEVDLS